MEVTFNFKSKIFNIVCQSGCTSDVGIGIHTLLFTYETIKELTRRTMVKLCKISSAVVLRAFRTQTMIG